jgi:hypothetical protein
MFRKVTLLIVTGILCVVAGTFDRQLAADEKCEDKEPNDGIYCPIQVGDKTSGQCTDFTGGGKTVCEGVRIVTILQVNTEIPSNRSRPSGQK